MKAYSLSLSIEGLHGFKNYKIDFIDNRLILIGENGAGKSTILKILYYLLSGQIHLITQYNFNKITVNLLDSEYSFSREELLRQFKSIDYSNLRNLPPVVRNKVMHLLNNDNDIVDISELENLAMRYDIPMRYLLETMESNPRKKKNEMQKLILAIKEKVDFSIIYLPTYRRIEQELGIILKGYDDDLRRSKYNIAYRNQDSNFVELIEFGMKDVELAINECLASLKEFARETLNNLTFNYLGDVVDKNYTKTDLSYISGINDEVIKKVLSRIDEKILSKTHKEHLHERIRLLNQITDVKEEGLVIGHYFSKLMKYEQDLQSNENRFVQFCSICNNYLEDKYLYFDNVNFKYNIQSKVEKDSDIQLKDLSSGEKQIVSLFSHLYLSEKKKYFVLIDEPELSLSVSWQKKFLDDISKSNMCSGFFAVTHSPFIYDNDLRKYAYSIGEFEV